MRSLRRIWLPATAFGLSVACASSKGTEPGDVTEEGEELLGGETTIFDVSQVAYSFPARNLSSSHRDTFSVGDHLFNRRWVAAPGSPDTNDGLGPTFNATSCTACHLRDGRGAPPANPNDPPTALLVRLSVPGATPKGGPLPEPTYGGAIDLLAIDGVQPEGRVDLNYDEVAGKFDDGADYALRKPKYDVSNLAFGPLAPGVMLGPRIAPSVIGMGLLEAISEETILRFSDEADVDGDGISGRPNYAWDAAKKALALGRFGWKASVPTAEQQAAGAALNDMGITSRLNPDENCPEPQDKCRASPTGGGPELSDERLSDLAVYVKSLGVPARRDWKSPAVRRGQKLFATAKCASCHIPKMKTGTLEGFPEFSNQTIRPFTDLLLHDMGEELADGRPDFVADGKEWRTAPLWGLGLVRVVNGHTNLMHDGRARNVAEAILWHGGEAAASRDDFKRMSKTDREALLLFLDSL